MSEFSIVWNRCKQEEWEKRCKQSPSLVPLPQSYAYGEMAQHMGAQTQRAVIYNGETPVALWQAVQKRFGRLYNVRIGLRGPIWLTEISVTQKQQLLLQLKCGNLAKWPCITLLMPEEEAGFSVKGLHRVMSGSHYALLNLKPDENALLAAQKGKWRNRLRAAQKSGVRVDKMGLKPENYGWLLEAEYAQRERKKYYALSPLTVPIYQSYADAQSVFGLQAWHRNERVAAMLFLCHGKSATYHIGWSSDSGNEMNAHNLLLWEAITRLKAQSIEWLDLGQIGGSEGLTRFKLGCGAQAVSLCGVYV